MSKPATYLGRKAAKATVKHGVRGTVTKAKREPPRTLSVLAIGLVVGAIVGWLIARKRAAASESGTATAGGSPETNSNA